MVSGLPKKSDKTPKSLDLSRLFCFLGFNESGQFRRFTGVDSCRIPNDCIDKKNARAFVFDADRQLQGAAPVLLGLAVGDEGLVDMSGREVSSLRPDERTTPAGRFVAEPGHNLQGEDVVWFDYAAKLAIHRLRPDLQRERRAQRLASAKVDDNRISLGCIVVPVFFYDKVIRPVLGQSRSVIYVLPETRSLRDMLGALQASAQ
jgi:hypothetical protein